MRVEQPQEFLQYRNDSEPDNLGRSTMARVVLSGLDIRSSSQLSGLLGFDGHAVRRLHPLVPVAEFLRAEIVFVGGSPGQYLPLLRKLRGLNETLPIIVVAPAPETADWLDALEAGATDYCVPPFDMRQVRSLVAPAVGKSAMSAAAGLQ
jgi:DNA-binding NtrC family response regulator